MESFTCRWCCPRSSPVSFCSVCSAKRGFWRVSREYWHCFVVSLDRRRGGVRGDGISAHGSGHASVLRSNRPAAGTGVGKLGANRIWTFLLVTLPLAAPGIVVGGILAFAKALGEFGAMITFVSNIPGETQTISAAIYSYTQVPGADEGALRLTVVAIVIALLPSPLLRLFSGGRKNA